MEKRARFSSPGLMIFDEEGATKTPAKENFNHVLNAKSQYERKIWEACERYANKLGISSNDAYEELRCLLPEDVCWTGPQNNCFRT